jgi:hypothetical protein
MHNIGIEQDAQKAARLSCLALCLKLNIVFQTINKK